MTPLRKRMIEDMTIRKHAAMTQQAYVANVTGFAEHFGRSPTVLGLEEQKELLLSVPHFLVTFTVPEELRSLIRSHQDILLNILFRTSCEALQQHCRDPRFVGGVIGMMAVLHTWTRDLVYHPHIHAIVPAAGLRGERWVRPKTPSFLVRVEALSVVFRAKFRDALRQADPSLFASVPRQTWKRPWVVHSKAVGNGEHALEYLARYVFRVAISNGRILSLKGGLVTFEYRDSETKQRGVRVLPAEEFIRRFLQHVLPKGFVKVRYYGLFASGNRARLEKVRALLPVAAVRPLPCAPRQKRPASTCPKCGNPMTLLGQLPRRPP